MLDALSFGAWRIRRVEAEEVAEQLDRIGRAAHRAAQGIEQPIHLGVGVVVDETGAHGAAGIVEPEAA